MARDGWRRWFVEIRLDVGIFLLGPCGSWSRARRIAMLWAADHGVDTTEVHCVPPRRLTIKPGTGYLPSSMRRPREYQRSG